MTSVYLWHIHYFMRPLDELVKCKGFDWDNGNLSKNWEKHKVAYWECEQIFFNRPRMAARDEKHSNQETRFYALGKTDFNRKLFVVFTMRNKLIRVVSARDMNRKEKREYNKSK